MATDKKIKGQIPTQRNSGCSGNCSNIRFLLGSGTGKISVDNIYLQRIVRVLTKLQSLHIQACVLVTFNKGDLVTSSSNCLCYWLGSLKL